MQAENSEKEKCIRDLRKQLERLEALTAHNGILRTDQMEQMISAGSTVRNGRSQQKGNGGPETYEAYKNYHIFSWKHFAASRDTRRPEASFARATVQAGTARLGN